MKDENKNEQDGNKAGNHNLAGEHGAGPSTIDIVSCLGVGWAIYKRNWLGFSLSSLIIFTILFIVNSALPFGGLLISGPLMVGIYYQVADAYMEKPYNGMSLLKGFEQFVPLFLITLLMNIFVFVGFTILIIPGVIVMGWYLLAYFFAVDKGYGWWQAMEASRKVAFNDMVTMSIFAFAVIAINFLGVLVFGVGLLVAFPITAAATFEVYRRAVGVDRFFVPSR